MSALKDLCLQDNNLVLVHDLNKAMIEARVSLLHQICGKKSSGELKKIPDLPSKNNPEEGLQRAWIEDFVTRKRSYKWHGIYYRFRPHAHVACSVLWSETLFYSASSCYLQEHKDEYNKLKEALEGRL